MISKKNILIVSTFFPPQQHIAVNRVVAHANYLSKHFNVTVVTLGDEEKTTQHSFEDGNSCKVYYLTNKTLLSKLLFYSGKEGKLLHKFKTLVRIAFNKLGISHYFKWRINAKNLLVQYLQNNKIDVVVSSYAPDDALEASYQALIENNLASTKWVLDMRDEYSDEIGITKKVKQQRLANELKYSKRADLVLAVSQPQLDLFRLRMPEAKGFIELRNGFDHEIQPVNYIKQNRLNIGYFGSLYGLAKPNKLFEAVMELGLIDEVSINFAIKNIAFDTPSSLQASVNFLPYMSYREAIVCMSKMDVNLIIIPSNTRLGVFSGKLFDYISSGRSIFAIVNSKDVAAQLILENKCGYVADFDSYEEVVNILRQVYKDWQQNKLLAPNKYIIAACHRGQQVNKLIDWINDQ